VLALIPHMVPISTHKLLFTTHCSILITYVVVGLRAHTINELLIATQTSVAPPSQTSGNPQLTICATFPFHLSKDLPFVALTMSDNSSVYPSVNWPNQPPGPRASQVQKKKYKIQNYWTVRSYWMQGLMI
jgi:hypothetical protein